MSKPTRMHRIKVLLATAGLAFVALFGATDVRLAAAWIVELLQP